MRAASSTAAAPPAAAAAAAATAAAPKISSLLLSTPAVVCLCHWAAAVAVAAAVTQLGLLQQPGYRLRQSFDQPRRVHVSPEDPSFEGRLTSEINSCYGPRASDFDLLQHYILPERSIQTLVKHLLLRLQLSKLLQDFGPHLTAAHCASAVSLLAGMATGQQQQQQQFQETYQAPAARAAELLTARISQASLLDCARATYGLTRLQLHVPALLQAAATHSRGQLVTATPQALAGLAAGLAHWGHAPDEAWQQELCVEAFAQLSAFGAQDLANLMFALAPLPAGMQQAVPEGAPVYQHHEEWRRQQQQRELGSLMGGIQDGPAAAAAAAAAEAAGRQQQQQRTVAAAASSSSSSSSSSRGSKGRHRQPPRVQQPAAATYRLPSFNWLTAFLAEARRQIDRMRPAELSSLLWCMASLNHAPDLIFMECWYRAAAARMHAFTPQSLALSLQALGMLRPGTDVPGGVSGRWLAAVLLHSRGLLGSGQQQCGGQELARLLWGFGELRFWPGQAWMDDWLADYSSRQAFIRFPSGHSTVQCSGLSHGDLGVQSIGLRPERQWLLRFKSASGAAYEDESAQRVAQFVAGLLGQQNRQRFSAQGRMQRAATQHTLVDVQQGIAR
ncbi:hypothetical protein COO60DRAFT_1701523 [Scenedesmus sp. NREL 46B-D3]|nr:hypothetical protein COO60DRAFT_1701523 [Scenedesmus sp. NREL 46B-D3]